MPNISVIIRYTKKADKFFDSHEDVRDSYEKTIRDFINGTLRPDVKKIAGMSSIIDP